MSETSTLSNTYTLEFDRDAQLIPTARIFAGALARQFGCGEDAVLDVKIAVSEACTDAVTTRGRSHDPVRIVVEDRGGELVYEVSDDQESEVQRKTEPLRTDADPVMGVALIGALFPGAEISKGRKGTHVRFSLQAPAA